MKTKIWTRSLFLISTAAVFTLNSCGTNPYEIPSRSENVIIEFTEQGGFGGANLKLTIDENNVIKITDFYINVQEVMNDDEVEILKEEFYNSKFFNLNTDYNGTGYVADGFTRSIKYSSDNFEKSVTVRDNAHIPDGFKNLLDQFRSLIEYQMQIATSGKLIYYQILTLEEWPFEEIYPLDSNIGKWDDIPEAIFTDIAPGNHTKKKYFKGNWIYDVSFLKENNAYTKINIARKYEPFYWNYENTIPLEDFEESGLFITGQTYQKVEKYLSETEYPRCFIDGEINETQQIYKMFLYKGNGFAGINDQ